MLKKKTRRRRSGRLRGTYVSTKTGLSMKYRSGWELSYMKFLDNNDAVVTYQYESIKIPYVSNKKTGKVRRYIPDLLVEYSDRCEMVEIKPSRRVDQVKNKKKFEAAREYCRINNISFVVVTEIELKALGLM